MLPPAVKVTYPCSMRKLVIVLLLSVTIGSVSAVAATTTTKTVKNCVNTKSGETRLVSEKVTKCAKSELLVKLVIPVPEPDSFMHVGPGAPIDFQTGHDGDFYIDTLGKKVYGPRVAGLWGTPSSMLGEVGAAGKNGAAIVSGNTPPDSAIGVAGDFYLDIVAKLIYGPKNERTGWGIGSSISGPQGAPGTPGPAGATGATGAAGAPGGFGSYGAFYDTGTLILTQNVPAALPLNTTQFSSGVSVVDGTKIRFSTSGKFNITFSSQIVKEDAGTDVVTIWLCKGTNGGVCINEPWSATDLYLVGSDARQVAAWNFFVSAAPSDYFQIMISSGGTTLKTKVISAPAQTSPVRPEVPATILTVNQVG